MIRKIDSYKDGGTITIQGNFKHMINLDYSEICLDRRLGKKEGKLWFGYPEEKDSMLIEDPELIKLIREMVEEHKKYTNYKLDEVINALK